MGKEGPFLHSAPNPIQAREQESRKEEERLVSKSPRKHPHTEDTTRRKVEKDAAEWREIKEKIHSYLVHEAARLLRSMNENEREKTWDTCSS